MDWDAFQQDLEDAAIVFVHDEPHQGREEFASLRKLPALLRLGFPAVTHPKSWRKIDQWSTNHFEFAEVNFVTLEEVRQEPPGDLIAITDQFYEDEYPIFSLGQVLNAYTQVDDRLLVAGNDSDFEPAGARRPLAESPRIDETFPYRRIYQEFESRYEEAGLHFPLRGSRNLFLQDNAMLYELVTGDTLDTITEVFYSLPDAPFLPLWKSLTDIFTTDVPQGTRLLDHETQQGLSKWLRRRIECSYNEGQELASYLNHLSRRHEQLFNPYRRARKPEMTAARETIQDLAIDDPELEARYRRWLDGPSQ